MIQSDKQAYLTDLSGSRGRTSGEIALSAHSEEHEVFKMVHPSDCCGLENLQQGGQARLDVYHSDS